MQPPTQDYDLQQDETTSSLYFPTIYLDDRVASWLAHSLTLSMASHADDSSVEENFSSAEDTTWDIIDEASVVTSDDEDRNLSRQPTPSSDGYEADHGVKDYNESNETSDESLDVESACGGFSDGGYQGKIPSARYHALNSAPVNIDPTLARTAQAEPFKFHEAFPSDVQNFDHVEVSHVVKVFEESEREQVSHGFGLMPIPGILIGTVRQRMNNQGLRLTAPYKILYVGPQSSKDPIVRKLGAALASSPSVTKFQQRGGPSRFTIVPISSFGTGSCPDVVLVNSLGLDMSVEDCISASYVKEEAWNDTISMKLDSGKIVESTWKHSKNAFVVSKDYKLPDVAIICLPTREEILPQHTQLLARSFMARHEVPVVVISPDAEWKKPSLKMELDFRTPHFCLEARGRNSQEHRVLRRLPIDLSTFLDIDASQMNRNLACIVSSAESYTTDSAKSRDHSHGQIKFELPILSKLHDRLKVMHALLPQSLRSSPSFTIIVILTGLLLYGIAFLSPHSATSSLRDFERPSKPASTPNLGSLSLGSLESSSSSPWPSTAASAQTSMPTARYSSRNIALKHTNTDLASFLFGSSMAPNKSDKFKVHVIGDCHIILRPPQWFTLVKRAPALLFKVTRQSKNIRYEFSTLFDGVYALKLPREDAYGILDISVWTIKRPKINETFDVDFGTPCLKVAGWKKATQVMTEQVRRELLLAQTGLSIAYEQTSAGVQAFVQDAWKMADSALKEVEKAGISSLNHTSKTTEIMITQSKKLSRAFSRQLYRHSSQTSLRLGLQHRNLRSDVAKYSRRMASLLTDHAQALMEAASGLNVVALAQEVQTYRENHFRETQKKALHVWWKVRGLPPNRPKVANPGKPKRRDQAPGKACRKSRKKGWNR